MPKEKAPKGDFYIFSTLSNDQQYTAYEDTADGRVIPKGSVFIAGGANRASDMTTRQGIYTPKGMVTPITEDEMAMLRTIDMFKLHEKNGYITVSKTFDDADDVAEAGMEAADQSAPLTPEVLDAEADAAAAGGGNAPIVADSSRAPAAKPPVAGAPSRKA